ncbi:MAG: glycosyl transferase, partial [Prevotella sp.]|nr:glycosyl transferase [Prevotella sp.]
MVKAQCVPDYIFESSWEVCHMVGGIYTVLSTRAKTMQKLFADRVFFIGPDFGDEVDNPLFTADEKLFSDWRAKAQQEGLHVRVGRWNVPGEPIALLVDFRPFYAQKNEIYGQMWADFQVDSLHGYGDYDEASMFSYAAAKVVESFYRHVLPASAKVVYQGHEWMTCLGLLYIHKHVPQIGTI